MRNLRKQKQERLKRVQEMYSQNMTAEDMAKVLGCARITVMKYVKELGLRQPRPIVSQEKIVNMYNQGSNHVKISKELNVSTKYVGAVLRKYGLGRHRYIPTEIDLIDENTQYAVDYAAKIKLEKVTIDGKVYEDITPIFAPR